MGLSDYLEGCDLVCGLSSKTKERFPSFGLVRLRPSALSKLEALPVTQRNHIENAMYEAISIANGFFDILQSLCNC
jgi:hypothetical protein